MDSSSSLLVITETQQQLLLVSPAELLLTVFFLLFLFTLSATSAAAEVAFFSLSANQLDVLEEEESPSANRVVQLIRHPKQLLATLLIFNNFVNISIVMVSYLITFRQLNLTVEPWLAFVIQTVLVTGLLVLFGEVLPKVFAANQPVKVARTLAAPVGLLSKILYPIASVMTHSTAFFDKRFQPRQQQVSIDELNDAIDITYDRVDTVEEKGLLKGIVNFGNISIKQIMQPRTAMVALDEESTPEEMMALVRESGFSRIPVFKENADSITGILHVKDLVLAEDVQNWQKHVRKAYFVPEKKKIDDLFKDFKSKRLHMAIAVDEYGGCAGLVTLEDILEEIVGELTDEFDEHINEVQQLDSCTWEMEGQVMLTDLAKALAFEQDAFDDYRGDADSVAGLIIELHGEIPPASTRIEKENLIFTVLKANKRKIERVRVELSSEA